MLFVPLKAPAFTVERRQQHKFVGGVTSAFLDHDVKAVTGGESLSFVEEFNPSCVGVVLSLY